MKDIHFERELKARQFANVEALLLAHNVPCGRWGEARRIVAGKQLLCKLSGIEVGTIDGLLGPQTLHAFEVYEARLVGNTFPERWRDGSERLSIAPTNPVWPRQMKVRELVSIFGKPGENIVTVDLPYALRIAWDKKKLVHRMQVHERVAPSMLRVLGRVANAYDEPKRQLLGLDLFGGCFNIRNARGSTALSMHSWGIALDFDPERNQLKWGKDKARLAQRDCEAFWRLWEEEGWLSLGRARDYDWMHVQAATL